MQTKPIIYDAEEAHNEVGQAIHDAKRRLLAAHRKGVPLTDAAATFFAECENAITRANARLDGIASAHATATTSTATTASPTPPASGYLDTEAEVERLAELAVKGCAAYDRERALVTLLDVIGNEKKKNIEDLVITARDTVIMHSVNLTEYYAAAMSGREIEDRPVRMDRAFTTDFEPEVDDATDIPAPPEKLEATPEWAEAQIEVIDASDDDEQKDALIALLASITPSFNENKYKHEIGTRAMKRLYKRMRHCEQSFREFVATYIDNDTDNATAPAPSNAKGQDDPADVETLARIDPLLSTITAPGDIDSKDAAIRARALRGLLQVIEDEEEYAVVLIRERLTSLIAERESQGGDV